ncbi:hypothetical protein Q3G72_027487 [Acer saccharum]|nr:hypothetical protein Q3G72_027487 [Acer saccharum]
MANEGDNNLLADGVMNGNLKNKGSRAPVRHGNRASLVGNHDQWRARRRENPILSELSKSDDGGIPHRKPTIIDSDTDEDTENWILGDPDSTFNVEVNIVEAIMALRNTSSKLIFPFFMASFTSRTSSIGFK